MQFLLLAILSSAFVSIAMRLSTGQVKNNMTMFLSNYAVCILLSGLFGLRVEGSAGTEGLLFPLGMGILSGVMYLGCFMLLQLNIRRNGVVLSSTFMKLGVIVPTVMAVVVFHETLGVTAAVGIVLALAAIVLINQNPGEARKEGSGQLGLLLILLIAGGFTDSLANIYDKCGEPARKDLYLLCTFSTAFMCSFIAKTCKKQIITPADLIWGAVIGIPNYFASRFLLLALTGIPATVVFPVYNIGTIILVTLAGLLFFREKLSPRKWLAMAIILLALFLLNL